MSKPTTIDFRAARRILYVMLACLLAVVTAPTLFLPAKASAAQLSSRSIQLSDSAPSGGTIVSGVGSGTNVAYQVSFTSTTEASSIVIEFCANDPLIGDSCDQGTGTPNLSGMDASAAVLNATAFAGTVQTTTDNWSVSASTYRIKLTNDNVGGSGGTNPAHDIQAATAESFQLTGITNPSALGTFYGRITTYTHNDYSDGTAAAYASAASPGNFADYGGIALSTVQVIQITARVQESLTFCVSGNDPSTWTGGAGVQGTCASTVASPPTAGATPSLTLGHGSPTLILDNTAVNTGAVWSQLSTNATNGAVVNMRDSNTTCTYTGMTAGQPGGGLSADNGTTCAIPPVNNGANTGASAITAGTAAFGLDVCAYTPSANLPATQTGKVDPTAEYNANVSSACPGLNYGMDTATKTGSAPYPGSNGNASTTYGSTIAVSHTSGTTPGPVFAADDELTFAATAGLTTPAGIYTANIVMIATGTF